MSAAGSAPGGAPSRPWNGTVVRSRLFDAISLLLPAAESFLIGTLQQWREQHGGQAAPALRVEVERLLNEEQAHRRAHGLYNGALVAERPAVLPVAQRADRATDGVDAMSMPMKLALAEAFEQLTAVLAHETLHHPFLLAAPFTRQARLWLWHAREELAHRHVAAEVAAAFRVGLARRLCAHVLATAFLTYDVFRFWRALCRCDIEAGAVRRRRLWWEGLAFVLRGAPSLLRMLLGWLGCFVPGAMKRWVVRGA